MKFSSSLILKNLDKSMHVSAGGDELGKVKLSSLHLFALALFSLHAFISMLLWRLAFIDVLVSVL